MNEEAQNALAELERMKQEMAAKLAAVSQMMAQMKPAPQTTDAPKPEQTATAHEAQNAPQTEPEQTDNKPENEPETEAELEPDEDEQTAEPDGENTPPDPAEPEDNKDGEDGEDKPDEKPADKPEDEKPPKWELKATDPMEEMMLAHLRKTATPELMARIEKKRKTIQGACAFCKDWAMKTCVTKEQLSAGRVRGFMGVMGKDEDLLGQMMHYFEEDELDCEPKPAPKPAPYKPAKPYTPPVIPKPAPKKPDPQMTLFDF